MTTTINLDFCDALRAIKAGKRAQRAGWNGKGLYAFLKPGSVHGPYVGFELAEEPSKGPVLSQQTIDGLSVHLFDTNGAEHTAIRYPQLCLSFPTGTFGAWAPSQTDMLASDWTVEDVEVKAEHPSLAKSARGYVRIDGRDTRLLSALKEFAISSPMPMARNVLMFLIDHPSLTQITVGEEIPTYSARWSDMTLGPVFERVTSQ